MDPWLHYTNGSKSVATGPYPLSLVEKCGKSKILHFFAKET